MPMSVGMIDRNIGEHQRNLFKYAPPDDLRQKANNIATKQGSKMPTRLCGLTVLFFMSVLSDIYKAENSHHTLSRTKNFSNNNMSERINTHFSLQTANALHDDTGTQISLLAGSRHVPPEVAVRRYIAKIMDEFSLSWGPGAMASAIPPDTAASSDTESVHIVKMDYICIEERSTPSAADTIKKVADTLESTLTEAIKEVSVLINYLKKIPCHNKDERSHLNYIATGIDELINLSIDRFPNLNIMSALKNKIPTFLRTASELIESRSIVIKTLEDISNSLVNLFDFSINVVFKNIHAFPTIDTAVIPKHLHLQQGNVILDIDNHQWSLFFDDGKYYAARNNIYHAILYDHQNNTWIFGDDPAQDNVHPSSDHFYTRCTVRSIQGASPHKFCRVVAENKLELKEPQPSTVKFTNVNQMDDNEHEAILARFDTGLIKSSPGVEALHFTNHWLIYRIRTIERGLQRFYHAIDINGRLIPARAKKISENRMRCEIYNRKQEEKRYCAEFQYQQWAIERDTSIHISDDLKNIITSDMFTIGIDSQKLSSPDERGIKTNIHGDEFIKFENHFIKLKKIFMVII